MWDTFSRYGDVLYQSDTAGNALSFTLANGMLVSQHDTTGTSYFLADALGSTRALTDEAGSISSAYDYDAFGELTAGSDPVGTDYLFTGQQYDVSTELYSLRARYYSPSMGRFLSQDTWATNFRDPMEYNRYSYAANNPATYRDPSGHNIFAGLLSIYKNISIKSRKLGIPTGALVGGAVGGFSSAVMYSLAESGRCGDRLQDQARQSSIGIAVATGVATGAAFGALSAAVGPEAALALGISSSAFGVVTTIADEIRRNEVTLCDNIQLLVSTIGLGVSAGGPNLPTGFALATLSTGQRALVVTSSVTVGGAIQGGITIASSGLGRLMYSGDGGSGSNTDRDSSSSLVYEPNPKHGTSSYSSSHGEVSPEPTNGQAALNNSVQVKPTSSRRVGVDIQNREFVVLDETHPDQNIFHGHVRSWSDLTHGETF